MRLNKIALRDKVIDGLADSGSKFLVLESSHPFLFRVYSSTDSDASFLDVRVYVWNCTHGGGVKRAADEYRIQITGTSPKVHSPSEVTLVLGWYDDLGVFAGFDIAHHSNQAASSSPSMQIKLSVLQAAASNGFSAFAKGSKEVVVAFRPEFVVEYARQRAAVHKPTAGLPEFVARLAGATRLSDSDISGENDAERREVLVQLRKKYRASDFRKRVLAAYGSRCAMCGIQLKLIEAAHIIPVPVKGSNDTTPNGVALCVLHHTAFDSVLVSFDESYRIEVNKKKVRELERLNLADGSKQFEARLQRDLILPAASAHYPNPRYIAEGRKARRWGK